jgi:hypothetical protein
MNEELKKQQLKWYKILKKKGFKDDEFYVNKNYILYQDREKMYLSHFNTAKTVANHKKIGMLMDCIRFFIEENKEKIKQNHYTILDLYCDQKSHKEIKKLTKLEKNYITYVIVKYKKISLEYYKKEILFNDT